MNAIAAFQPTSAPLAGSPDTNDTQRLAPGAPQFSAALDQASRAERSRRATAHEAAERAQESSDAANAADLTKTDEHPVVANETSALRAMLELAARENAAATNATVVVKDTAALQPEMKAKVERVIQRMKDEAGLTVNIAETWRSQTRQDALFEQGRSRSGPVVTWTQNSRHTAGLAADLVISGANGNPEQYAMLQRIAGEEGLRTLGAKDPGHVELNLGALQQQAGGSLLGGELTLATAAPAGASSVAPVAQVATVASVAPVAQVAQVAQVADVAQVAQVATVAQNAPMLNNAALGPNDRAGSPRGTNGAAGSRDGSRDAKRSDRRTLGPSDSAASSNASRFSQADAAASIGAREAAAAGRVDAPILSTTVQRLEAVMKLQEAKQQQPMNQMLLRLDNGMGGEDRVRVGTMGSRVGAALDFRDGSLATQIGQRSNELIDALAARGLSMDSLNVRTAAAGSAPTTVADLARALSAAGDVSAARLNEPTPTYDSSASRDGAQSGQKNPNDQQRRRPRDPKGEQE